jgi:hypothetical protein
MVTQTLVIPATIFNNAISLTARLTEQPVHAQSHDYGFDHNEAELATELRAPLPKDMVQHELADVSNTDVENSNLYLF